MILGHELSLQNEFESAIQSFRNAIRIRPRLINAYIGIGDVYMKEENYDSAVQIYRNALEFVPKSASLWMHMGRAYHELGINDTALRCFEKVTFMRN